MAMMARACCHGASCLSFSNLFSKVATAPPFLQLHQSCIVIAVCRFAVVEDISLPEDIAYLRAGLAIVHREDIVGTVLYYLKHTAERHAVATRGHALFKQRSMAVSVLGCVNSLLMTRGCEPVQIHGPL